MSKVTIATAPCSWGVWYADGTPSGTPWNVLLDQAAAAGYKALELGPDGYLPTDEDVLREDLTRRGLDVCSGTCCYQFDRYASFDDFRAPVDALCKRLTAFGAKYLVAMDESDVGLYSEKKADFPAEVWNNFLEKIRLMGEFTKNEYGVEVVYHPHIKTMIETEALCQRYGIQQVLVHTIHETILRTPDGLTHEKTRFVAQPRSSTGAGDHFNGASCFALLAGLSDRDRVHFAGVFASTYVSKGSTPTLDEVLDVL